MKQSDSCRRAQAFKCRRGKPGPIPTRLGLERLERREVLAASPVISEFMAINDRTLLDVDGDFSDWIEVHNAGDEPLDLAGWSLTDDASDLDKWKFPSVNLPAGGFLVVFASDKNRAVAGGQLHTNFKLTSEGEYLALVQPDGVTIASQYAPAFPPQAAEISYGLSSSLSTATLLATGAAAKAFVPASDALGTTWTGLQFDDASWISGTTGVGFEAGTGYQNLLGLDLRTAMYTVRGSAYIRLPFEVADPAAIASLTLRMKYDDGFFAYLNGAPLTTAARNVPGNLSWNSTATQSHSDSLAVVFEDIDLSAYRDSLVAGTNVLAIHGLNQTVAGNDFLIIPELVATVDAGASGEPVYFTTPTPGAVNSAGVAGLVADTKFSVDRGFYDAPFTVEITTATPGATIRYTTNGSPPTATTGTAYTGPVPINTTTTLRAAAFKNGFASANVDTQTYLFLDDVVQQPANPAGYPGTWSGHTADYAIDQRVTNNPAYNSQLQEALTSIPTLSLVSDVNNWFSSATGIYANPEFEGVAWERPVSAELIYADGREGFQIDAGVRIQGGTSTQDWKSDKLSMRLLFKDEYGDTKLNYPLFADSDVTEFNTLVLDAHLNLAWTHPDAGQQVRAQYVRDTYVSDLQNALGSLAPHTVYAHVYLNGLYWGLYYVHERPDAAFAEEYLGGDDSEYDVIRHTSGDVVDGTNSNYLQMFAVANAGLAGPEQYQLIQQYLDVDDFIDYMIVNFYVGNTDWAHHNWYATRNRVDPAGRWRYHSWDAEHVLKGIGDNVLGMNNAGGPTGLHQRLLANADYRMRFADHVQRHFFNGGQFYVDPTNPNWDPDHPQRNQPAALYMNRIAEIDPAVIMESARWGDNRRPSSPYTRNVEWAAELNWLLTQYFPQRSQIVLNQFRSANLFPALAAPTLNQHGGPAPAGFDVTISAQQGSVYYTLDGSDPRVSGGGLSPRALLYNPAAPIEIQGTTQLKTRALAGGTWSPLIDVLFTLNTPPSIRVNELNYHPVDPPAGGLFTAEEFEFVELVNTGPDPVNLFNVQFTTGIDFTFPSYTLAPDQALLIVKNQAAFESRYGAGLPVLGTYGGQLDNAGERLVLVDALGSPIQDFTYADDWYAQTDGGGFSLVARDLEQDLALWSQADGWRASNRAGGSPGVIDEGQPPIPGDLNGDGAANNLDISPFALALTDPAAYAAQYPDVQLLDVADINADGEFNNLDISPFAALLVGAPSTPAGAMAPAGLTASTGTTESAPYSEELNSDLAEEVTMWRRASHGAAPLATTQDSHSMALATLATENLAAPRSAAPLTLPWPSQRANSHHRLPAAARSSIARAIDQALTEFASGEWPRLGKRTT